MIDDFSITKLNSTAVQAMWTPINGAHSYIVYYFSDTCFPLSGHKSFSGGAREGVIVGVHIYH